MSRVISTLVCKEPVSRWPDGSPSGNGVISPIELCKELNMRFPLNRETCIYFTLVLGILNVETKTFRYVSAGHPEGIHVARSNQETELLIPGGPPIGMSKQAHYREYVISLNPGDRLYLYSDGLIDAFNPKREIFGKERLIEKLEDYRDMPLNDSLEKVFEDMKMWSVQQRQRDDVSILAVEIQ